MNHLHFSVFTTSRCPTRQKSFKRYFANGWLMVCGRCIKHPSTDAGGRFVGKLMKKILFASNKHDRLFKSLRTFACAKENELPLHRNKPEHEGICRSEEILCLLNTYETCLCSVLYARWGMFLMSFRFSHLSSSYTQPHHTVHHIPPLRMGGCLPAKCNVKSPTSWRPGKIIFTP